MKLNSSIFGVCSALALLVTSSAFAGSNWVSIIYNAQDGVYGTSWSNNQPANYSYDQRTAEERAIDACNSNPTHPNTCQVSPYAFAAHDSSDQGQSQVGTFVDTTDHGWIALAVGPNHTFGTAQCLVWENCHARRGDAEAYAVQKCNAKPGSNNQCRVIRSLSAGGVGPDLNGTH